MVLVESIEYDIRSVEDEDLKLSDDVVELGPGLGCTSPQQ